MPYRNILDDPQRQYLPALLHEFHSFLKQENEPLQQNHIEVSWQFLLRFEVEKISCTNIVKK